MLLVLAPAAGAETTLRADRAIDRTCTALPLPDDGAVDSQLVTAPALGLVRARLRAGGDWDLGIFDARSGATVAGSAYAGGRELAEGIVLAGERLLVQACRRDGSDRSARLTVSFETLTRDPGSGPVSMVRISTPTRAAKGIATSLGLDITEHGGPDFLDAVLYGPADAAKLTSVGLSYTTLIGDLSAYDLRQRRTEARYARRVERSALPSGRDTYRRLFDYSEELKRLAKRNPRLVRLFRLPFRTWEGRPVQGIEITRNVRARDGKPVFAILGLHHAREWPSGEHTMEWARELISGYKKRKPAFRRLVSRTRTIVIPVVNPDGFNTSREAGQLQGAANGRGGPVEEANIVAHPYEYRRKNCRLLDDSPAGDCNQPSAGLAEPGVDPNRNYGSFWGGPGASDDPTAQDYHGPGPFSEPETKNIRWIVSRRQVTTLITNHTFSNLVLRPPGLQSAGNPPDARLLKRLGDAMAAENGYVSQPGWKLYDTTGTTEDWSYSATGGLGYTFEIGPTNFHPPFADVVAEYRGTTEEAGDGGGNRAAFLIAQRNTANPKRHSVIAGRAPAGVTLRISKSFRTPTSVGTRFRDRLQSVLEVPASGRFVWHVNPSTRPLVAKSKGKRERGEQSDPVRFSGAPGPSAMPCADFETEDEACFNDHSFTVPGGRGIDNGKAVVGIAWLSPGSDWDMKVMRDANGDGSSLGEQLVGSSASGGTADESTTVAVRPGRYVVRVINYAATEPYEGSVIFRPSDPFVPAKRERWTLRCLRGKRALATRKLYVKRGQRRSLDLRRACAR